MDESGERESDGHVAGGLWFGLLAGLLIGALAGAVAMLLLAPQSGKKTRAKLEREGNALRKQTAETVEVALANAQATARGITRDITKQAKELEQRGQAMFDAEK